MAEDGEEMMTDGQEVRVMASLLGTSAVPPLPSLHGWTHPCGIAVTDVSRRDVSSIVGILDVQYERLSPEEVELLVNVWRDKPRGPGCMEDGSGEESEDDGEDFRHCATDMLLSQGEKESLRSLLSEAPNRSEMVKAANLLFRRSESHREELRLRDSMPMQRRGDRAAKQSKRRKEAEMGRRDEEAMRREWGVAAREKKESSARSDKHNAELLRGHDDASKARGNDALSAISVRDELMSVVYPTLILQRAYERSRDEAKRLAANGGDGMAVGGVMNATAVGDAATRAIESGTARFGGGPREKEFKVIVAELQGIAATESMRRAQKEEGEKGRLSRVDSVQLGDKEEGEVPGGDRRSRWSEAESWFEGKLSTLKWLHKSQPDHPSILSCKSDLASARAAAAAVSETTHR